MKRNRDAWQAAARDLRRRGAVLCGIAFLVAAFPVVAQTVATEPSVENSLDEAPIFKSLHDPDKLALLIKQGADVNARDSGSYTPLARVLSMPSRELKGPATAAEQTVRSHAKIDTVRLLLDAGAEINANVGGLGRDGALALVRREDADVIDLLVARGATLKDPGIVVTDRGPAERGPLTIAVQLERDDLALAMLRRDGRIGANDNLALIEAIRRGFADVALAMVKAGADPNALDGQGNSALAWALRRRDDAVASALRDAGATRPAKRIKPPLDRSKLNDFEYMAANEIDEVALFDPYRFHLTWFRPRPQVTFAFYGTGADDFEAVKCTRSATFSVVARANIQGGIKVGVCKQEIGRIRKAADRAETGVQQVTSLLPPSREDEIALSGWAWRTAMLPGGWKAYTYPVLLFGPVVLSLDTVVLLNRAQDTAVIVQADLRKLCEPSEGVRTRVRTPLCDDQRKALLEIALAIARRS